MCPSYMATRLEEHSTRGRANALVKALTEPDPHAALGDERLHEVLDLCLMCKACKSECPLGVDMATLKSEALPTTTTSTASPLRSRVFGGDPHAQPARRRRPRRCPTCPAGSGSLRRLMGRAARHRAASGRCRSSSASTLPRWFRRPRRPDRRRRRRAR